MDSKNYLEKIRMTISAEELRKRLLSLPPGATLSHGHTFRNGNDELVTGFKVSYFSHFESDYIGSAAHNTPILVMPLEAYRHPETNYFSMPNKSPMRPATKDEMREILRRVNLELACLLKGVDDGN